MGKICLLHTTDKFMELISNPFSKPFLEENKDISIFDITDSSLIAETSAAGYATKNVKRRMYNYITSACEVGADCIIVTCTSVNKATKEIREFISVPIISIEEPVAKEAVEKGCKIGILASLGTSAKPVAETMEEIASGMDKEIDITIKVADGAFEALMSGDRELHDQKLRTALDDLTKKVDIVVLSQISMALLKHDNYDIPILKIGKSSYEAAKKIINN